MGESAKHTTKVKWEYSKVDGKLRVHCGTYSHFSGMKIFLGRILKTGMEFYPDERTIVIENEDSLTKLANYAFRRNHIFFEALFRSGLPAAMQVFNENSIEVGAITPATLGPSRKVKTKQRSESWGDTVTPGPEPELVQK